ncbi:BTAD domain-containing putative transcriptional regulator [Spirillospora sp. NPDC047279]|uniref:ATP-binding protein n=1 Tax=Spirillospora sp. NPDC047279 TaxID=3155478 RepID=UPI0033EF29A2
MTIELTLLTRVVCRGREVSGARSRGLLALLAGELRAGCGTARLVAELWPEERPEHPAKALQVIVSRTRSRLGADLIDSTPTGYRLTLDEEQVDASVVLLRAAEAVRLRAAGDHAGALARAEEGLALFDGPGPGPGGDAPPGDPVAALRAERMAAHRSLARVRALSLRGTGRAAEAVEPLTGLLRDAPRDEEILAELLRCEAAAAGPSAALERYEAYRRGLRDELGTDPGAELRAVQRGLLEDEAPPVRHGVRHEPNAFLGRGADIAAVTGLLRTSRVTSVVGPGGLGKTRLAHAVSRRAEQRVVHFVPLAGVRNDADVAGEVASALDVAEAWGGPGPARRPTSAEVLPGILHALGSGPVLLVLDNCEQVIDGAAELVRALVSMSKGVRVLTTSRAPLGLTSESVYPLPELSLETAVELFEQRARAVRPGVPLPAADVRALCGHLDGLPLAVELAAARVKVMSVAEISRRLRDRFAVLRGGPRDAPERHRTLHAVVDWSWNLLAPGERAAMRMLSVLPDGFTADTAARLLGGAGGAGATSAADPFEALEHLVDQSLLKVSETAGGGTRFRMLETVREFSAAERDAAGEAEQAMAAFLGWARDFAVAHHGAAFGASGSAAAIERVREEQDNLLQALRHGFDRSDRATVAGAFTLLSSLWFVSGSFARLAELAGETAAALSRFRPEPELVEVTRGALAICALSSFMQGPYERHSIDALRELPPAPPATLAQALATVLVAAPDAPRSGLEELLPLAESGEPLLAGTANLWISYVYEHLPDMERAMEATERALREFERARQPWMRYNVHSRLAEMSVQLERGEDAVRQVEAAMRLAEEITPRHLRESISFGMVLGNLARGNADEAERWLDLATRTHSADENFGYLPAVLGSRAEILLSRGRDEEGLAVWRTAAASWDDGTDEIYRSGPPGPEPWSMETLAAAVVAHAQRGRLDLAGDLVDDLLARLPPLLLHPMPHPPAYLVEMPICGTGLLAVGMVDIDRAARTGDRAAARSGARLVALAERFAYLRRTQPTMKTERARAAAEKADGPAYAEAVSEYAGLDPGDLRVVALAALRERPAR